MRSLTIADFDRLLLKFGIEDSAPANLGSTPKRLNALAKYLIDNPDLKGPFGSSLLLELIEEEIERINTENKFYHYDRPLEDIIPKLIHSLNRDGYVVESGKLKTALPKEVDLVEADSELFTLLDNFEFFVAKGHLEQAISAHTRGDWASANSQLRTFTESLFDFIAQRLKPDDIDLPESSHQRREFLARIDPPFLMASLNEWEIGSKGGFLQGFWRRLHPEGSHPGLSSEQDCTFRLHLIILVSHHLLKRLETF